MKQQARMDINTARLLPYPLTPILPVDGEKEIRCECGRLLAKGEIGAGGCIEIKCPKCKTCFRVARSV
jgi:hypothetical protein